MDFHKQVFGSNLDTASFVNAPISLLCKTNKNFLRTKVCPQMIVHLARQGPCWWRVESLQVILLPVCPPNYSNIRMVVSSTMTDCQFSRARGVVWRLVVFSVKTLFFVFFAAAGCCLVGNLVAPLLDGLNDLLNDGSLSDGPHGGSDVGCSLGESESVGNGGSVGDSRGSNGGSNGSNGSSGSVASVGRGGVASVGGGVTGKASVAVSVGEPVGVGHLRIGLSGGGGDSDGENDESEHDDLCWLGSE